MTANYIEGETTLYGRINMIGGGLVRLTLNENEVIT